MSRAEMARRALTWPIVLLHLVAACSLAGGVARAQDPASARFRRVLVPQDALEGEIRGLLPLKRAEFERRIRALAAPAELSAGPSAVRLETARFKAALRGGQLEGTAELTVVKSSDQPALLTLEPCNIAIQSAAWSDAQQSPVVMGCDPQGRLRCLVDRSGVLRWTWSARAEATQPARTAFLLQLPAAPRRVLEIEAASDLELSADAGLAGSAEMVEPGIRRWNFELNGSPELRLVARPAEQAAENGALLIARESSSYTVLTASLEVATTISLEVPRQQVTRLELTLDEGLTATSIELDGTPLPFTAHESPAGAATVVVLELPSALAGFNHALQVSATADWPAAGPANLPRIAVAGSVLQEGQLTLLAPAWLKLQARAVGGCQLASVTPAAAGRPNDEFQFQLYRAGAKIEFTADLSPPALREESGATFSIEASQVKGVLIADLSAVQGERFTIEALLSRQWVVDAVEVNPPEALADRSLLPRGAGQQLLRLNLSRAVSPTNHVQLIVRAHARRPPNGRALPDGFFSLASFPDVDECRRLVNVQIDEPGSEFTLAGENGFSPIDPDELAASDLRLFESPPSGLLIESKDPQLPTRGTLTQATARYRADVLVTAEAAAGGLRQTISIRCQPDASAVNSLLARLAPRPAGQVVWRIEGGQPGDLVVAEQGADAQPPGADADPQSGEPGPALYRLTLTRARNAPFELVGEWTAPQSPAGRLSLAWLPEASIQTGVVEFHVTDASQFLLVPEEVEALPAARGATGQPATLRARFRYDASQRARIRAQPAAAGNVQRGAWIEKLHLTSFFSGDGRSAHEAALAVRNAGLAEVSIRFPPGVADLRWVDASGTETPLDLPTNGGDVRVPLAAGSPLTNLRLRYSASAAESLSWFWGTFAAPVPEIGLPVLIRHWSVGLPPAWSPIFADSASDQAPPAAAAREAAGSNEFVRAVAGPAWGWKRLTANHLAAIAPGSSAFSGWSLAQRELPSDPVASIAVYQPRLMMLVALCAALAVAAVVASSSARRWIVLPPALALVAALALLAPGPLAWLSAGLFGGMLAGCGIAMFRLRGQSRDEHAPDGLTAPTALPPASAVTALLVIGVVTIGLLPRTNPIQAAQAARLPRVVIPVDENQAPAGDYVYLEPPLYELLHRQANAGPAEMPAWLLEQAGYDFTATTTPNATAPAIDEFSISCDFYTFLDGAIFSLPLHREKILLRQSAARLDGLPVTPIWRPDGTALEVSVPAPGKHRLELSLGALARRNGNAIALDLPLTRAAASRVVVPPAGAEIVSGQTALVIEGRSPPRLTLPSNDVLSIRWPASEETPTGNAGMLADQLLWWKLRPGSVVLEAKFRLQPVGGPLQQVAIAVDPRLRLLPAALAVGRVTVEEGPQHVVKVEFSEPQEGPVNLRLSWLWPEVTGLGELRFPGVQIQADRVASHWQAISAAGGLEIGAPPKLPAVSAADFMQAWGETSAAAPTAAFDMREAPAEEPVLIQPASRLPRAEQSLQWSLHGDSATAHLNVLLSQVPESRFEYQLPLPPQMEAVSVKLLQAGRTAAVRWLQQPDGLLWLTLLEPPTAEQELTLVAELPLPRLRTRLPLAAPRLHDVVVESSTMRIFRQPEVDVQLESPSGWTLTEDSQAGVYQPGRGRLVASLRNESAIGDTQPIVSRTTNRPKVQGFAFIRAHEADGDWRGEFDLALNVESGVLDDLRLTIPDSWAGPLEFEPPLAHHIEDLPGPRKRLTMVPAQAISGAFAASIRGSLHGGEAGLAAPDVALTNLPGVARIVLLDRGQGGQRIDWETTGLMPANPRELPLPDRWTGAGGDLLRVVGPRFDATARLHQETTAAPRVRLAHVRLTIASGGRISGVGHYTIRPGGARGINLVLPSDCRLVQTLIDGVATPATSQGPRNWELPTPSSVFPFELTVVFDGALGGFSAGSDLLRLAAPRLPGMLVERTAWEIATPSRLPALVSGEDSLRPCSPEETAVLQLEAAARSLDDVAAAKGTEVLAPVLAETAAHWNGVYLHSKSLLSGNASRQHAPRVQAAEALAARARERLAELNLEDQSLADRDAHAEQDGANSNSPAASGSESSLYLEGTGEVSQVTLQAAPLTGGTASLTNLCAALFVGLAAISVPLARWPRAQQWFAAHAHLLLALAGLLWWLFAPLGWIGWIAVLVAVRLSVRFP